MNMNTNAAYIDLHLHLDGAITPEIAKELDLAVSDKPDSQDICFVPDGDYGGFIEGYAEPSRLPGSGDFVGMKGEILGRHKGIIHYTIGQRKGLGLSLGRPVFVKLG